jgi:radical SAM superfamily enzyme YgiQ (UPF0313 family)
LINPSNISDLKQLPNKNKLLSFLGAKEFGMSGKGESNPRHGFAGGSLGSWHVFFKVPPMGLLNVAAVKPSNIDLSVVDEDFQDIDFNTAPDLVGISALTAAAPRAYEIASMFRRIGVPVVLGGPHPSVMYEEARKYSDTIVIGEAEEAWEKLLSDFLKNVKSGLKPSYRNQSRPDLAAKLFPRLELLKSMGKYAFTNLLHTSRGCPYKSSFCSVKQLFKELAELDIMWISQASINSTGYDETHRRRDIHI